MNVPKGNAHHIISKPAPEIYKVIQSNIGSILKFIRIGQNFDYCEYMNLSNHQCVKTRLGIMTKFSEGLELI